MVLQKGNQGFTLLELVVALTITALIAIGAYRVLEVSIKTEHTVMDSSTTLQQYQNALWILSQDLIHADPKSFGKSQNVISFNRHGVGGAVSHARSNILFVKYYLDQNKLVREYRSLEFLHLPAQSQILLTDIDNFGVSRTLPQTVEILLATKDMGTIKRVIEVPGL